MPRTDNLTNDSNNKKHYIFTKEGKKSKRHKKLLEDDIESAYEYNLSPKALTFGATLFPFFLFFLA